MLKKVKLIITLYKKFIQIQSWFSVFKFAMLSYFHLIKYLLLEIQVKFIFLLVKKLIKAFIKFSYFESTSW